MFERHGGDRAAIALASHRANEERGRSGFRRGRFEFAQLGCRIERFSLEADHRSSVRRYAYALCLGGAIAGELLQRTERGCGILEDPGNIGIDARSYPATLHHERHWQSGLPIEPRLTPEIESLSRQVDLAAEGKRQ